MPGIRFVSCHSPGFDTSAVSFLPLPFPRKIGIGYFCHVELLGPRRQGTGSDWSLGKNPFQVICPPETKLQRWDAVLPGTLFATLYFVFLLPSFFYSTYFPCLLSLRLESYVQMILILDTVHLCVLSDLKTWSKRKDKKPLTWGVLIYYHLLCHAHICQSFTFFLHKQLFCFHSFLLNAWCCSLCILLILFWVKVLNQSKTYSWNEVPACWNLSHLLGWNL